MNLALDPYPQRCDCWLNSLTTDLGTSKLVFVILSVAVLSEATCEVASLGSDYYQGSFVLASYFKTECEVENSPVLGLQTYASVRSFKAESCIFNLRSYQDLHSISPAGHEHCHGWVRAFDGRTLAWLDFVSQRSSLDGTAYGAPWVTRRDVLA